MKILIALILSLTLTACGGMDAAEPASETVTIQTYNAGRELIDVEVPYDPQRIAVLDMPALDILDTHLPVELLCVDAEAAMQAIAEVDGRAVSEDIVTQIFSRFCVGK